MIQYYIRRRGDNKISGPHSVDELNSLLQAGTVNPAYLALEERGQTPEQLEGSYLNFRWTPLTAVHGLSCFEAENGIRPLRPVPALGAGR